jgi:hypothetical protein
MPTPTPAAKPQETSPQARDDPAGYALRFFGTDSDDVDRVKIALDAPSVPADVGAEDFTLEWWMKASLEENRGSECTTGNDNWITGNIIFDRDIWGGGDYGDYGVSLAGGHVAFGVNNGTWGEGICSTTQVADGLWHHIAVTRRRSDGLLTIFVDGRLDAQAIGPEGDVSYRDGRDTGFEDDPYLVIGAEKHDAGPEYPSYNGWLDEVRLSNTIRYGEDFTPPSAPFVADGNTVALWHFDESSGEVITDASPQGRSVGVAKIGGPQAGPRWVMSDAPLGESK